MDIDVFVAVHRHEWDRLESLLRRSSRLSGAEVDELVALYQRTATHLSTLQSAAPDPALLGRLSTLVARARSTVSGAHAPAVRDVGAFVLARFPAAVYRSATWWVPVAALFVLVVAAMGAWVANSPEVQANVASAEEIRDLTRPGGAFESYYSSEPAASFAAQVWTNNAWVAAGALALGVLFGLPVLLILGLNALNVGVSMGLLASAGRLDIFFGLIIPHGLLELTAVFIASGAGLRLGWTVIDPGPRTRSTALAVEGRATLGLALGLTGVLLASGVIEAFVTPSGLPTWARIAIGVLAEGAFIAYVTVLGGRAVRAGETGDLAAADAGDALPASA